MAATNEFGETGAKRPVVVIAAANEAAGARHLRSLASEVADIVAALGDAQKAGICDTVSVDDATPEKLIAVFQSEEYRDRVAILHFAGHAGPEGLLFETSGGGTTVADARGLAAFLGCQRGLQLVVLNACATEAHVDALRDAGVGAVIATSQSVEDAIAHQFAVLLYQGLGGGAGIRRAYDEAAAGLRFRYGATDRGATVESMHASADAASAAPASVAAADVRGVRPKHLLVTGDGRWPWDLYFRRGAEDTAGPWNLPDAAGNPLFGLPRLPETDALIESPFRHLRPFTREHAEIFFGRGKDIRELYDKVTSEASAPVVLLYGATGVGKSSLLDAGLLPRLTGDHEVRFAARDRALGLLGTLITAIGGDPAGGPDGARLAEAWHRHEAACGRPLFVVVDQVEQAFTTENTGAAGVGDAGRELDVFVRAIGVVFTDEVKRPRGRLVLGFRKEWLADVKSALASYRVPKAEHHLEQLTRDGVLEAITGPTRVSARRMPARLELEAGLDVLIADDLLAKRASHVAPLLQILLAGMWTEAPRHNGVVRFDVTLYESVQAKAKQLEEFLTQQLSALRVWHATTVDSGLALDFLRFYTTAKGTADEHTAEEEAARYPRAGEPAPGLRAMCVRLFLLVERTTDDVGTPLAARPARLAHDTLAPLVRERFDRSDLPGPRAKRILDGRSVEWGAGKVGTPLDASDLKVVEAGEAGMRAWNAEERALVAASRVARDRARRRRAWAIRGAIAAVTLIVAFGVGSWLLYRQSQVRLAGSQSRELAARALGSDPTRRDLALLYAVAAYDRDHTFDARRALFSQLSADPGLVRVLATNADTLMFTADDRGLILMESDSLVVRDIASGRVLRSFNPARDIASSGHFQLDASSMTYSGIVRRDTASHTRIVGVWDAETGRRLGEFPMQTPADDDGAFWAVAPGRTGENVAAFASSGGDVVISSVTSGAELMRLHARGEIHIPGAFSVDGSVLVTGNDRGDVTAWDVKSGTAIRTVSIPSLKIAGGAVGRGNDTLMIVADDSLFSWSLSSQGRPVQTQGYDAVKRVAFSPDRSVLAFFSRGGAIEMQKPPYGQHVATLRGTGSEPQAIEFSRSGKLLAAVSGGGFVHVWDVGGLGLVRRERIPLDEQTRLMNIDPSGLRAFAWSDSAISVWDVASRQLLRTVSRPHSARTGWWSIGNSAIGAGARLVAVQIGDRGFGGTRTMFDVGGGATASPGSITLSPYGTLAVDPRNDRLAYGLPGTNAVVLTSASQLDRADTLDAGGARSPLRNSDMPPHASFSPDGTLLAMEARGVILIWDVARRQVRDSLPVPGFDDITWASDGRVVGIVSGSEVSFWQRTPSKLLARAPIPFSGEHALSPDGTLFASVDGTQLALVDVERGEDIGAIELGGAPVRGVAFTADRRTVVVAHMNGVIDRVDIEPESWADRACVIARSDAALERWTRSAPAGMPAPGRCDALARRVRRQATP